VTAWAYGASPDSRFDQSVSSGGTTVSPSLGDTPRCGRVAPKTRRDRRREWIRRVSRLASLCSARGHPRVHLHATPPRRGVAPPSTASCTSIMSLRHRRGTSRLLCPGRAGSLRPPRAGRGGGTRGHRGSAVAGEQLQLSRAPTHSAGEQRHSGHAVLPFRDDQH
jgi:hypothetical protein